MQKLFLAAAFVCFTTLAHASDQPSNNNPLNITVVIPNGYQNVGVRYEMDANGVVQLVVPENTRVFFMGDIVQTQDGENAVEVVCAQQ